jgi:glutathione S-transferase
MTEPIALSGAPGSPYTRKMLAVLRYRRIPYRFLPLTSPELAELPQPKPQLLPTFYLPDAEGVVQAVTDSTPLIRRLEREHAGRSVIPADPVLAFLDALIEDYADEWLTKAMFHYRWSYAPDIAKAALMLPCWRGFSISDQTLAERGRFIAERQIGRLRYVGSNAVTGPVIEAGYRRFLEAFEAHLKLYPYLLGRRPGASDFAVYGQLTQLAEFDPTPMALTLEIAPRVTAWVGLMEDQSGAEPTEGDWIASDVLPETLEAVLAEIGRVYAPLMLANAAAVQAQAAEVVATVDGRPWVQQPFPYQAKCLGWLRQGYAALEAGNLQALDAVLGRTGLRSMFSADA